MSLVSQVRTDEFVNLLHVPSMAEIEPLEESCTRCDLEQSRQHAYGGSLARAILTQQSKALTLVDIQIQVIYGPFA